jgi:hypothetical protein
MSFILLFTSIILGLLRVLGVQHIAFQAAAHMWCGGLLVASIYSPERWFYILLLIALCIVELLTVILGPL